MNWKDINKEKPIAVQTGDWDGKKSEPILVMLKTGRYVVVEMYEGCMDGSYFCDFVENECFYHVDVTHWAEITHFEDHHPDTGKEIEEAERRAFYAGRAMGMLHWVEDRGTTVDEDFKLWKEVGK